jgi:type I restriction enzyme S subunit
MTRSLQLGDLVLEASGTNCGRSLIIDQHILDSQQEPLVFSNFCRRYVVDATKVVPEFLGWALRLAYATGEIQQYRTGSAMPNLDHRTLTDRLIIPAPPTPEQWRIVGVLKAVDDLIGTSRRLADDLMVMRRVVVERTLGQSVGFLPLSSIARFVNGRNFTKDASGQGRPVIRTPEVRRGPGEDTIRSDVDAPLDHVAKPGDILFVWSGSLMVDRWLHEDALVNQHIFKVIPEPGVPSWLAFALIEHQMPWFLGLAADKATTMGHIQRGHLDAVVPMPGREELAELDLIAAPLWEQEFALRAEAHQMIRTRDDLLPMLLSGRVRVDEVAA